MPYTLHPSKKLVTLFKEKPWQGNRPEKAHFLFVGLGANYSADIEKSLPEVFDHLRSGVEFWRANGVHHPFRLQHYRGSGKRYHDKFAEIGFTTDQDGPIGVAPWNAAYQKDSKRFTGSPHHA